MSDIYVITTGEYSDHAVHCAFTEESRADAYCKEMNKKHIHTSYSHERIDLDPPLPSEVAAVTQPSPAPLPHDVVIEPITSVNILEPRYNVICRTCTFKSLRCWTMASAEYEKREHITRMIELESEA